jgi:hypothetical protein
MPKKQQPRYIDHDRLFKEVLTEFFFEFLELFISDLVVFIDRNSLTPLDKEIFTDVTAGQTYEVDILFRAKFKNEETLFLLHVEPQSYRQIGFNQRMFEYFASLFLKYKLPVYSIALFSYDSGNYIEPNEFILQFPNGRKLGYDFDAIQLNRLNWQDYLNRPNPVASALMANMKIAKEDRVKAKLVSKCWWD